MREFYCRNKSDQNHVPDIFETNNELEALVANDALNTVIEDVCEFNTKAVESKPSN